jgi:hypothetical protein
MTSITQQLEGVGRVEDRRVEVASIGKSNCDANLFARGEPPGRWQQIKHQLNRLSRRDWLQLALEVIVPGQAKVIERGRTQHPMRCPQIALRDVGRIPVPLHLFQIDEGVEIDRIRAQPQVNDWMPGDFAAQAWTLRRSRSTPEGGTGYFQAKFF